MAEERRLCPRSVRMGPPLRALPAGEPGRGHSNDRPSPAQIGHSQSPPRPPSKSRPPPTRFIYATRTRPPQVWQLQASQSLNIQVELRTGTYSRAKTAHFAFSHVFRAHARVAGHSTRQWELPVSISITRTRRQRRITRAWKFSSSVERHGDQAPVQQCQCFGG